MELDANEGAKRYMDCMQVLHVLDGMGSRKDCIIVYTVVVPSKSKWCLCRNVFVMVITTQFVQVVPKVVLVVVVHMIPGYGCMSYVTGNGICCPKADGEFCYNTHCESFRCVKVCTGSQEEDVGRGVVLAVLTQ